MGFALWLDSEKGLAWAQGTHEYHPMGVAVIACTDRFRARDFLPRRRRPALEQAFVGSLEEVNFCLRSTRTWKPRPTPAHLL